MAGGFAVVRGGGFFAAGFAAGLVSGAAAAFASASGSAATRAARARNMSCKKKFCLVFSVFLGNVWIYHLHVASCLSG